MDGAPGLPQASGPVILNMFIEHVQDESAMQPSTSFRRAGQQARAQRVLDAAAALFGERGFDATSVRDIAAAASVSVGTVLNVGDKTGLFLAVLEDHAFAVVGGGIAGLRGAPVDDRSLADEIAGVFDAAITWVATHREVTRDYLIAYLRAGDDHRAHLGDPTVIVDGVAERCLQHSDDERDRPAAGLAAHVVYGFFVSLVLGLAAGTIDVAAARQGLRAVVDAQLRPFERRGGTG
jgi:AcrR family transcriptional regulator